MQFLPPLYYSCHFLLTPSYSSLFPIYLSRLATSNLATILLTSSPYLLDNTQAKPYRQYKRWFGLTVTLMAMVRVLQFQVPGMPELIEPIVMMVMNGVLMSYEYKAVREGEQGEQEGEEGN